MISLRLCLPGLAGLVRRETSLVCVLSTLVWLGLNSTIVVGQSGPRSDDVQKLSSLLYRSCLSTAEKALRLHELRDAKQWLEHAPSDLRGWEWQFMDGQCDECIAKFPMGDGSVTSIDLSSNGSLLAIAAIDGSISLFQMPEYKELRKIGDHRSAVYSVSFSPEGTRLATVSRDVTSRVWDVATGREISRLKLENPGVAETCFSPSGEQVATCSWMMVEEGGRRSVKGVVWVWDAQSGEVKAKKHVGEKPLDSMQWSSDGSRIVVGSWGGLVHVLDAEANELRTLGVPEDGIYNSVISVALSDNGKWVAAGSKDRTARVWSLEDGALQATMSGHDGFVNAISFTGDSQQLITASVDGTSRVWDVNSGKMLQALHGHTGSVIAIELTNEHRHLISVGRDQQLRVWDLSATYGGRTAIRIEQGGTYTTTFSPDGSRLFIACFDGHVRVVDTSSGKILHDWKAHESSCNSLSLNREGTRLLTCSWDKTAKLWDTSDLSLVAVFTCQKGVTHCALSPEGTLAALAVEKDLQIWNVERREQSGLCEGHDESLIDLVFSPDGESVATSAQSGPARIWNAKTNELVATLGQPAERASTVVFSSDGRSVATGKIGGVSVWDVGNYQLRHSIGIGNSPVSRLAFSPDGKRLAVGSDTVSIVDPDEGTHLLRFQPNDDTTYFLAFSPDGSRLASCTTLGLVTISETRPLSHRLSQIRNRER